jgi:5'-nucleotidase
MRALITNDDGIDAPGLHALADAIADAGIDVVLAAPAWNSSGASAALTGVSRGGMLAFTRRGWRDGVAFAVEASPSMIVRIALNGAFGSPPDVVLSGINDGPNTGHAVLHSGTVGAALTAATHGCRAIAFSAAAGHPTDFRAAASLAPKIVEWSTARANGVTLNVNVPSGPPEAIVGLLTAPLASFGAVQTHITEEGQDHVSVQFADVDPSQEPDSDAALLAAGYATVAALAPVCADEAVDLSGITTITR